MATMKHRLTISLAEGEYEAITRIARVQEVPRSRIISDLLAEVVPVLLTIAEMTEQARGAQTAVRASLRRAVDTAEADMLPQLASIYDRLESLRQEVKETGRAARGATASAAGAAQLDPRPVITGVRKRTTERTTGNKKGVEGCLCTCTKHERQENPACPVHFPAGARA